MSLQERARDFNGWWQILFLVGAAAGGFLSIQRAPASAPSFLLGFLGGFLMITGSRMGDGCTSGHGISGMSHLSLNSFVAVPAMFAAAIATALVLA